MLSLHETIYKLSSIDEMWLQALLIEQNLCDD